MVKHIYPRGITCSATRPSQGPKLTQPPPLSKGDQCLGCVQVAGARSKGRDCQNPNSWWTRHEVPNARGTIPTLRIPANLRETRGEYWQTIRRHPCALHNPPVAEKWVGKARLGVSRGMVP